MSTLNSTAIATRSCMRSGPGTTARAHARLRAGLLALLLSGVALALIQVQAKPLAAEESTWAPLWSLDVSDPAPTFRRPMGVAVSPDGTRVYVSDRDNHRIVVHDRAGRVLDVWGGFGRAQGRLYSPGGLDVDPDGSVLVADTGNERIQRFAPDGRLLAQWGGPGEEPGEFASGPLDVAVAPDGAIYTDGGAHGREIMRFDRDGRLLAAWDGWSGSDVPNPPLLDLRPALFDRLDDLLAPTAPLTSYRPLGHRLAALPDGGVMVGWSTRVTRFSADGEFLLRFGEYGEHAGAFRGPPGIQGMALTPDGRLIVTDGQGGSDGHVQAFSLDGTFLAEWRYPRSVAGDIAAAPDGQLYLAQPYMGWPPGREEPEPGAILRLSAQGHVLERWGSLETGPLLCDTVPRITILGNGTTIVSDAASHRLQRFDRNGRPLAGWGGPGSAPGRLHEPRGSLAGSAGSLYVVDRRNHRVQHLDAAGRLIRTWGAYGEGAGELAFPDDIINARLNSRSARLLISHRAPLGLAGFKSLGQAWPVLDWELAKPELFGEITGISPDGRGGLALADIEHDVVHVTDRFDHVAVGGPGTEPGRLLDPQGVMVFRDELWVADTGNDRLQRFDLSGRLVQVVGGPGTELGRFDRPTDLKFDEDGTIVVADAGNERIQRLSHDGVPLDAWPLRDRDEGRFVYGHIAAHPDGGVVVNTFGFVYLERFNAQGRYVGRLPLPATDSTGSRHWVEAMAVDREGLIWLLFGGEWQGEELRYRRLEVVAIDEAGRQVQRWHVGDETKGYYQGLASADDRIFVLWHRDEEELTTLSRFTATGQEEQRWSFSRSDAPDFVSAAPDGSLTLVHWERRVAWTMSPTGIFGEPWTLPEAGLGMTADPEGRLFIPSRSRSVVHVVEPGGAASTVPTEHACGGDPHEYQDFRTRARFPGKIRYRQLAVPAPGRLIMAWIGLECLEAYGQVEESQGPQELEQVAGRWRLEHFAGPHHAERPLAVSWTKDLVVHGDKEPLSGDGQVPSESFSIRATRRVHLDAAAGLTITATARGGLRMWVDDRLVIDEPGRTAPFTRSLELSLAAGDHVIVAEQGRRPDRPAPELGIELARGPAPSPSATPAPSATSTPSPTASPETTGRALLPRVVVGRRR